MVNELRAVVKELGGRTVLGRNLASQHDLSEAIREGFPPAVVEELMEASGLTLKELADALDLSARSLQRRRRTGRLARFEVGPPVPPGAHRCIGATGVWATGRVRRVG